ncbi:MAG TPA: hypothetical protein GX708_22580 [Gallicola sp.]|jgi:ABC-type phosphate transport system auxiliary subunit|nr:hypothetical protein [Gallicola sp.]
MDRKLIRKYGEREKLQSQIKKLQDKLEKINREVVELEKVELYKNFEVMNISLEEYKSIVEKKILTYQGKERTIGKVEEENEEIKEI